MCCSVGCDCIFGLQTPSPTPIFVVMSLLVVILVNAHLLCQPQSAGPSTPLSVPHSKPTLAETCIVQGFAFSAEIRFFSRVDFTFGQQMNCDVSVGCDFGQCPPLVPTPVCWPIHATVRASFKTHTSRNMRLFRHLRFLQKSCGSATFTTQTLTNQKRL